MPTTTSRLYRLRARLNDLVSPQELWLIAGTLVVTVFLSWLF